MSEILVKIKTAMRQTPDERELRLNNDTGLLKILACLFMVCDHAGKMFFPNALILSGSGTFGFLLPKMSLFRAVGRLAMPLFAYCIAVGCLKTRNIWKYAFRILLLAILVQPLYQEAMGHVRLGQFGGIKEYFRLDRVFTYYYCSNLNILFSLFLASSVIGCYRARAYLPLVLTGLLCWCLQNRMDYGIKIVFLICIFYATLDRPLASFMAVFLFMWYWGMPRHFTNGSLASNGQLYAIASLPLIYIPMKRRVKLPKWSFYAFYPAHLLVILLLQL